jgi:hypothetical protein
MCGVAMNRKIKRIVISVGFSDHVVRTTNVRSAVMMKKLRRKSQLLLETRARSSRQRNTKKRLDAVGWFVPQRHSRRARRTRPEDTQC